LAAVGEDRCVNNLRPCSRWGSCRCGLVARCAAGKNGEQSA
jgi:hypothetical protein